MIIERVINGKINDCWNILMDGFANDVKQSTGKSINLKSIKQGYTYKKRMKNRIGQEGFVKVVITKLTQNSEYTAKFYSSQGVNTLTYKLIPIDANSFKIDYIENFESEKKFNNWNFKLMSIFYNRSSKKRANLILDYIQRKVEK
jgi:hypothetical protein